MIKTYIMNIRELDTDELFAEYFKDMSKERQDKILAAKNRMDKNRSLGAGVLLVRGLLSYGIKEKDAIISCGENGKPYLAGVRCGQSIQEVDNVCFNLSHSGEYAAAVFGADEVGVDIEHIRPNWRRIADHYFTEEECKRINSLPDAGLQEDMFLQLWTMKESAMKASGEGMRIPLASIEAKGRDRVKVSFNGHEWEYSLRSFPIQGEADKIMTERSHRATGNTEKERERYRISVCAKEAAFEQELIWVK